MRDKLVLNYYIYQVVLNSLRDENDPTYRKYMGKDKAFLEDIFNADIEFLEEKNGFPQVIKIVEDAVQEMKIRKAAEKMGY